MQVQKPIEKGTLLSEVRAKVTTETIKEITPFGIRAEVNYAGEVAGASYSGRHVETVSLLLRTDGGYDGEAKILQSTNDGDVIVGTLHGVGRVTGPTTSKGEGEVIFVTQSPKLSWMNNRKCRVEWTTDSATGELDKKFFAL